ncbi:unnamed protein product [Callosobruchus maculatus]|uniref:Uncharacterized protein n=1 Tax=Callosobruchus maculatus TaxID=64391 RepID=A0A653DHY6_CALMS|nr:unnamed protein product [Callosobruchus maculatus]
MTTSRRRIGSWPSSTTRTKTSPLEPKRSSKKWQKLTRCSRTRQKGTSTTHMVKRASKEVSGEVLEE